MILSSHVLIGAAIGANVPNPIAAFIFSLISHYLFDALPHWDYVLEGFDRNNKSHLKKIAIDLILSIIIMFSVLILNANDYNILMGIIGAALPDILEGCYRLFDLKSLNLFSKFHCFVHSNKNLNFWLGLPTLTAFFLIAILLLI